MNQRRIDNIFKLLDDEDDAIAIAAIAQLLEHEKESKKKSAEYQESTNPLLRRRIHQLESALLLRNRRKVFSQRFLQHDDFNIEDALIEIQLMWYDNDSISMLEDKWQVWNDKFNNNYNLTIEDMATFGATSNFTIIEESTLAPEYYCFEQALEKKILTSSLFCLLLKSFVKNDENFKILFNATEFAFLSLSENKVLRPLRNWHISTYHKLSWEEEFTNHKLVEYISMMLFTSAVNSDSFRYILTIAQSITGLEKGKALENLPYPYNTKPSK